MSDNEERQKWEPEIGERIARLIRSNNEACKKPLTDAELLNLKTAANRFDQMLKAAADADAQELKNAAARLDQLLQNLGAGKDISMALKLRRNGRGE
jgi:hypothetical protein